MMLWILAGTIGPWLAYLLVMFWALRSDTVRKAVNRHPDRFFITWRSASSWFPGAFRVEGLRFVGQGTGTQYFGDIREARFRVRLLPLLLFRREISVGTFHGRGVEFQLRRPSADGATNAAGITVEPPIPGLEELPHRTAPRKSRGKPSWWIRVDHIAIHEIERIWIHGTRLDGPGRLDAALDMQVEGPFHVRAHRVEFPSATVTHNGAGVATALAIDLSGALGPLTFDVDDVPGNRLFEFISAELRLAGDLGTVAMLGGRFGTHAGIGFTGEGRIDADLRVAQGVFQPGTRLTLQSPKLQVAFGGTTFEGSATVEDRVVAQDAGQLAELTVQFRDLVVARDGNRIGSAEGPLFRLTSTSRNLGVASRFEDAEFALRLDPITLTNATWLGEFIPAGSGIALTGGAIRLDADLHARAGGPIQGDLHLAGDAVAVRLRDEDYEGSLRLGIRLVDGAGGPRVLHLRDTELTLTNLFVPTLPRDRREGWHAKFAVPDGRLDLTNRNWRLDARFEVGLRDTRPILAILRSQPDAPGWLRLMPTLRELEGAGRIITSRDLTQLSDFSLSGKGAEFRAELLLSPHQLTGILYARYGPVAAGFDQRSPDNPGWRVVGAKRWFEEARANPFAPPDVDDPRR